MTLPELKCEICRNPAAGVASSCFGAISHALCADCAMANREPWSTLVGGLMGLQRDGAAEWTKPFIEATCAFYGKTEDELWVEVAEATAGYEECMNESEHKDAISRHREVFRRHGFDDNDIDFSSVKAEAIEAMAQALYALETPTVEPEAP